MESVDAWEVRGLQIFCLLVLMASGLGFSLRGPPPE
jgi:hypothetical protein